MKNANKYIREKYYEWIDVAKGIGILLVIIGHCIFPLHSIIDVFHMPLFFFIAGITFKQQSDISFLIAKTNRIVIPYCFWMILSSIISLIPHPYTGPFNGPLWFLPTIFVALIIMHLVLKLNHRLSLIITFVLFASSYLLVKQHPSSYLILLRSITGFLYIFLGYKFTSLVKYDYQFYKMLFISIVLLCCFTMLFVYLYIYCHLDGNFVSLTIYSSNYILTFICSVLGILFTICLAKLIRHNLLLSWLGENSLVIMCVHFPVAQMLNVYIASSKYYNSILLRGFAAICEYIIIISFSCICAMICNKYIPRLTGYKRITAA